MTPKYVVADAKTLKHWNTTKLPRFLLTKEGEKEKANQTKEAEIQRDITTEPETEIQLELEQLLQETPAQIEPVQSRAPAPVPHKLKHKKKTQAQQ